jgi:hypothetical protein
MRREIDPQSSLRGRAFELWKNAPMPIVTITKTFNIGRPVNPILANPVYLASYIEQMGTGTTDIIDRCVENGLRKPEFHQDEDFRAVLWRPEVQVAGKVDKNIARIILAIRGNTVSTREIMVAMQLKGGDNFRNRYLYPSIEAGYVSKLYPDSESRPDQAYYLTDKGLQLLSELLKK